MSSNSRCREVTKSIVYPDVKERAVLVDKLSIPEDNLVLQEINNYPKGGKVSGGERGDNEETILEAPHHIFTAVSYALVTVDHGVGGSTSRGTPDFFHSQISKMATEKAFVEAEINGDNFHCIHPQSAFTVNNPPLGHITIYTHCLSYGQLIPFHLFVKRFCHLHNISLVQLVPNFGIVFSGMWILWHRHFQRDLTMGEFFYINSLHKSPQSKRWHYVVIHPRFMTEKTTTLVEEILKFSHE